MMALKMFNQYRKLPFKKNPTLKNILLSKDLYDLFMFLKDVYLFDKKS